MKLFYTNNKKCLVNVLVCLDLYIDYVSYSYLLSKLTKFQVRWLGWIFLLRFWLKLIFNIV